MPTDLYDQIVNQRGSFEKLMLKVPGYKGYKDASDRRAADRMVREHVVALLREQMTRLVGVEKKILNAGGLSQASATKDGKQKFQLFIDRVATAMPGYAGFFDAQKVGQAELEKIYNFDAALITYVDKFREAIDALDKAAADKTALPGAVSALQTAAEEANNAYSLRENVLKQLA